MEKHEAVGDAGYIRGYIPNLDALIEAWPTLDDATRAKIIKLAGITSKS